MKFRFHPNFQLRVPKFHGLCQFRPSKLFKHRQSLCQLVMTFPIADQYCEHNIGILA